MTILHVVLNMSHFVIDSRKIFLVVVPSAHFNSEILEKKSKQLEVKIRKQNTRYPNDIFHHVLVIPLHQKSPRQLHGKLLYGRLLAFPALNFSKTSH